MEPFIGEIRYVAFNFPPRGWTTCKGQLLPIAQNTALFSLLGTTYGGDGRVTFGLPDLQGRVALGNGSGLGLSTHDLGERTGSESVTLIASQLPAHTHSVAAGAGTGTETSPTAGVYAKPKALRNGNLYAPAGGAVAASDTIAAAGGGQPHENRAPGLVLTAIIALEGIFPARS